MFTFFVISGSSCTFRDCNRKEPVKIITLFATYTAFTDFPYEYKCNENGVDVELMAFKSNSVEVPTGDCDKPCENGTGVTPDTSLGVIQ